MVWCASSYGRNWQTSGIVPRFIRNARDIAAIGKIDSFNVYNPSDKKMLLVDNDDDAIAEFIEYFNSATNSIDCSLSGNTAVRWELTLAYDFNPGTDTGIGRLFLEFGYELNNQASEQLWQAFCNTHDGDDCSYAFMHPFNPWISVRDKKQPLVNCATFETVLWANQIGSDQMRFFNQEQLQTLDVAEGSPQGESWLRFRLLSEINDLVDKDRKKNSEKKRSIVDKQFRLALKR